MHGEGYHARKVVHDGHVDQVDTVAGYCRRNVKT